MTRLTGVADARVSNLDQCFAWFQVLGLCNGPIRLVDKRSIRLFKDLVDGEPNERGEPCTTYDGCLRGWDGHSGE